MPEEPFIPTTPGYMPGSTLDPFFRDQMDARRSMWRRTPDAEYPDGYLGTIVDRRQDRLLEAVKGQLNRKVYDRGVHKGEKIDQSDYFWPDELDPWRGLRAVAAGVRQAPAMTLAERLLVNDGKSLPYGNAAVALLDPKRQAQLVALAPRYR